MFATRCILSYNQSVAGLARMILLGKHCKKEIIKDGSNLAVTLHNCNCLGRLDQIDITRWQHIVT